MSLGRPSVPRSWRFVAVAAFMAVAGCGKVTNRVTGSVTVDGEPLLAGLVSFLCDGGGKPVIESAIQEGRYEIVGPPPGKASIIVQTFPPRPKLDLGEGAAPPPNPGVARDASEYVPIPSRYTVPKTSGLECTIVTGTQTFDIELKKR